VGMNSIIWVAEKAYARVCYQTHAPHLTLDSSQYTETCDPNGLPYRVDLQVASAYEPTRESLCF
jgi:hypothetical protein